jgi:two-component system sensor histidine kinase PilS (NtrC family)
MLTRPMMNTGTNLALQHQLPSAFWRSIRFSHLYRLVIATGLLTYYFFWQDLPWREYYNNQLYLQLTVSYLSFSLVAALFSWSNLGFLDRQLTLVTLIDICFIVAMIYAAGGLGSGLGLLLVLATASASLFSQGRLALFYASIASIALLLEQSYQFITWTGYRVDYTHAVMVSLSCFATAWLAHSFSRRTIQSEALASQRGIDLENMAQINQLITQEIQDGVIVVDKDFRIRHCNIQAELLLGHQHAKYETLEEYSFEISSLLKNWVNEDSSRRAISTPIKLRLNERELRLRLMPISCERREGAVIFIEDWSQIQLQAQQMKLVALGRLTANIAHEIRNPLSAISHANQLLQEEVAGEPARKRIIQIIDDNVTRLDQIVKDVLELNRRDRTQQEVISIGRFLQEFYNQFCQIEKIPTSHFRMYLAGHEEDIWFDRRHLNQILWNICRNGWQHSRRLPNSLTLSLLSTPTDPLLTIAIKDDGDGISEDVIPHLFEPFFTTESNGTGLGLYIARELCEANDGRIEFQPTDSGCLFLIQIKRQITP